MRRAAKTRWVAYPVLCGLIAFLAAIFLFPVRIGDRRRRPTPERVVATALANARYASLADAEFGRGRFAEARRRYEAIDRDERGMRSLFGDVRDKIAATYVAEGDYRRAFTAYRRAETLPPNTARSDDGTRKAQMVLLAYRYGDVATFARLMGELERHEDGGPALPLIAPSSTDPVVTRNPTSFRRLGRILAAVHHRSGAEFAYRRALTLSNDDPSVGIEWAGWLERQFHDPRAGLRVLRAVAARSAPHPSGFDPDRVDRLESEIKDLEDRTVPAELTADRRRVELARQRWWNFRGQGVYDPTAPLIEFDEPDDPTSPEIANGTPTTKRQAAPSARLR